MEVVTVMSGIPPHTLRKESFQWVVPSTNPVGYDLPVIDEGTFYGSVFASIEDALKELNEQGYAQRALDDNWQLMRIKVLPTYLPKKAIKASMPAVPVAPPVVADEPIEADAPVVDELPAPPAEIDVDVADVAEAPVAEEKSWIHDDSDDDVVYEPEVKAADGE